MKTEIPSQQDNPTGLHFRYSIRKIVPYIIPAKYLDQGLYGKRVKISDSEIAYKEVPVDKDSEYFVMRLDEGGKDIKHVKACRIGIHAYADAIQDHLPDLANDLKERYPLL